jgi:TRAP-type mannitol/chloroaromatic compound transport system permease small subunit
MTSNPHPLQATANRISRLIEWTGRSVAWLTLAMVVVTFMVVVFRYVFDLGWIWLQESISYMHAFVFMLGIAYTFRHNAHVRVDILYSKFTARQKAWVDLTGCLLLVIPVCGFVFLNSWDNVIESWVRLEGSEETGGLDLVFVLKTAMLLMPLLLLLQAVNIILRNSLFIRGIGSCPEEYLQREHNHG